MRRLLAGLVTLAACAPALPPPQPLDLRAALETAPQPAVAPDGACWGTAPGPQPVWFRVPCPEELTPDDIATLQRALQARGHFVGEITGRNDDATATAVRQFQAPRGLDSPVLALATAQALGVAVTPLD